MPKPPLANVFDEVRQSLEFACQDRPDVGDLLDPIKTLNLSDIDMNDVTGCVPIHQDHLDFAISNMPDQPFRNLKSALTDAKDQLHWRVDDGGFYADGANVGTGYKTGNMHALLVGPKNSLITSDDFLLGFFLLTPRTLYRDHKHLAPEIYLPLTGPSGWRFAPGDWEDHDAGRMIYNAPNVIHATRVYDIPFLSIFAWTGDIDSACSVVDADDWDEIEANLQNSSDR